MSTDISTSTVEPPAVTGPDPTPQPDKVMRIAAMTKRLLAEVRAHHLDAHCVDRLRAIDIQTIRELQDALTPDLREELEQLTLTSTSHSELSDTELRIAHAQLAGWLEGLLATLHTAANNRQGAPKQSDHPDGESVSHQTPLVHEIADEAPDAAVMAARRTLKTAIIERIAQLRLTAARAASLLHLDGPRVTKLFHADIDDFTLDELVEVLPALGLTIQVVPEAEPCDCTPGSPSRSDLG